MQIVGGTGLPQSAPNASTSVALVVAPASPLESARRVTANREGGRGDLSSQHHPRGQSTAQSRGRLIDLLV